MNEPLLKLKNVSMSYDNHTVVRDVSFVLNEGDYLCAVGENGSGKSTLIKGILGLVPVKSGKIEFLNGLKRNEIGYLPQQTQVQHDFPASVSEVVLSGCLGQSGFFKPFYSKADKQKMLESLGMLGIEHLRKKSYRELSGGQQQRVLLARAVCSARRLLLLDEPVTGLDPIVSNEMYGLIKDLNEKHGVTVIMVSHDIRTAVCSAGKILHLDAGVEFFGTCSDYLRSNAGRRFLGGSENV